MHPYSTVQPITQRLVQVHAIVEKIAGVNGPLILTKGQLTDSSLNSLFAKTATICETMEAIR